MNIVEVGLNKLQFWLRYLVNYLWECPAQLYTFDSGSDTRIKGDDTMADYDVHNQSGFIKHHNVNRTK
ncbi:MAG: hypothetical protein IPG55_09705 [Saprospiraceae bacterium]|nr:hypothetical protein [Candidatus Defluviibacterium haderslevense]MBK7243865.1 hypothetical protein [Candidatus Defluviibacterium haderslevense]